MKNLFKNMNGRQRKMVLVVILLIAVVAVVGISFSIFTFVGQGTKQNTIGTGVIEMAYTERSNQITINNAMPMTEEEAINLTNSNEDDNNYYFDFTVSAKVRGKATIFYDIVAAKNPAIMTTEAEEAGTLISDDDIRLRLEESTNNGSSYTKEIKAGTKWTPVAGANEQTGAPAGVMLLYTGTFGEGSTDGEAYKKTDGTEMVRYFRLRMWVDSGYEVDGTSRQFSVVVNVYGKTSN